jgi:two-component system LytT family response regulator
MKLKTFTTKSQSSSYDYFRGMTLPHAELDCSTTDIEPDLEETLRPEIELPHRPRLIGERGHRFHFLDVDAVEYLQVEGNYVTIHAHDEHYLTRSTLKHLSSVLAPYDFIRIDRSVLLNLGQVEYVERLESGRFSFHLRSGLQLVSNRERSGSIVRLLRHGLR